MYIGDIYKLIENDSFYVKIAAAIVMASLGVWCLLFLHYEDSYKKNSFTVMMVSTILSWVLIIGGLSFCMISAANPRDYTPILNDRLKEKNISISKEECQRILNSKSNNYYDLHITTSEKDGKESIKTCKYKIEDSYLRIYETISNGELNEINLEETEKL